MRDVSIRRWLLALLLLLPGCVRVPEGIEPVRDFRLERYLGDWYEIARLENSFEKGLTRITANYSLREDGGVRVLNRGWSEREQAWQEAEGRAYFVGNTDEGFLKVSFFGPFYGSYVVFDLDRDNYGYALVAGPDRSYLWLLARTPTLPEDVKARLLASAAAHGFDVGKLIFVSH